LDGSPGGSGGPPGWPPGRLGSATGAPLLGLGQGPELLQPGPPQVLEHHPQGSQLLGPGPVQAPAPVPAARDQAGFGQDPEMLGDAPEGDVEAGRDVTGRPLPVPDQPQDLLAAGLGDGPEGRGAHGGGVIGAAKMWARG